MIMTPGKPAADADAESDILFFNEGVDAADTDEKQPVSADWLAGSISWLPCSLVLMTASD